MGYGDITPHTVPETVVTILVFVLGILFFGILLGSISDMLQRASQAARRCPQMIHSPALNVDLWLAAQHVSGSMHACAAAWLGADDRPGSEDQMLPRGASC